MQENRVRNSILYWIAGLSIAILAGVQLLPLWAGLRNTPIGSGVHTAAQTASELAAAALIFTMGMIAAIAMLQPGNWGRKLSASLPALTLLLLLVGIFFNWVGIGAGLFAEGWLAVSAVVCLIAIGIAVFTVPTAPRAGRIITLLLLAALALGALGGLGTAASLAYSLANPFQAGRNFEGEGERGPGRPEGGGEGFGLFQILTPLSIGLTVVALILIVAGILLALRTLRAPRMTSNVETGLIARNPAAAGREFLRALLALVVLAVIFILVIQLIPVNRVNPPVQTTIQWDSQQTKDLAYRACMDCHSNETQWPWYAQIAPGSWLTVIHVNEGRERLNFSEMNSTESARGLEEIDQQIQRGSMPLADYMILHPSARLTGAEKQALIQGFNNSLSK